MTQRIGIYGGCFDPIHNGHLYLVESVKNNLLLDKIIFVPVGDAPHKNNIKTNKLDRFNMTVLATQKNNFFEVSDFEISRDKKSYTIDTVNYLKQKNIDAEIFLIIGSDEFIDIKNWTKSEDLFNICNIIVVLRPDKKIKEDFYKYLESIRKEFSENIFVLDINALNISSTEIRNRVAVKKNISHLVPENIEKYICKKNLYLYKPVSNIDVDAIKNYLAKNLTFMRFTHSTSVADTAIELADYYKIDISKAYIAGLLHDCAKEICDQEKIKLCGDYKIPVDSFILESPGLAHQFLSAQIAQQFFNINQKDILDAIKYHTTGRANMSILEKIIYIADRIEPNRTFDDIDYLREMAYKDLDQAIVFSLQAIIKEHKNNTHPLSLKALEFYDLQK